MTAALRLALPVLATTRLRLEPLGLEHSDGMFALWSAPEVCRYSGSAEDFQGRPIPLPATQAADSDRIIDFFVRRARAGTGLRWAVLRTEDAAFLGAVGFNSLGVTSELAYHLRPGFWGHGFMSEACRGALEWVAGAYACTAVEAFVEPDNVASIALLRRLGFHCPGEIRDGAERWLLHRDAG